MNINLENLESFSLHLSGVKTFPAVLNKRSTAADDDGTDRTLFTSGVSFWYFSLFSFQKFSGLMSTSSHGLLR